MFKITGVIAVLAITLCSCGEGAKLEPEHNFKSNIEEKCIDGHLFYFYSGFRRAALVHKLNDNGLPVRCEK